MATRKSIALVWFRQDLRLADNPALRHAIDEHERVIPIYIHDTGTGHGRPGAASDWWLHHSLEALDADLRERGSRVILRRGDPRQVLAGLVEETGARSVFWNRCYEPAAVRRDSAIKNALSEAGVDVSGHNASLLFEPWALKTADGGPYRVFSPFWRACLKEGLDRSLCAKPREVPGPARWPLSQKLQQLELLPELDWDAAFYGHWTPGEQGANERLRAFLQGGLTCYPKGRDHPGRACTSRLSPHLHFGEIGPRQAVKLVQDFVEDHARAPTVKAAEAFLREIGWREFAYHLLFHFPHTTERPLNERFADFPWRHDYGRDLNAWRQGRTGIPIVDAGMRELWSIGWMHNRVRMIVGSLLVKNLLIPWQEGERWFWDTLVDADLASNTLGWQWVAGCGADAAPFFRVFNPVLQGEKFDADGEYVRRWVPELRDLPDKFLHKPWDATQDVLSKAGVTLGETYPKPIVDLKASRERALEAFERVRSR
jgi:deoxyribodipyrimidine photo-lyase